MRFVVTPLALALALTTAAALGGGGCKKDTRAAVDASAPSAADAHADARATAATSAIHVRAELTLAQALVPGFGFASVTRDHEGVGAAGLARVQAGANRECTADTVFEAASIAKLVVATCVMQLVDDGKLDLDANASNYVGFALRHPRWPEPITLRMLLTHRASIRDLDDELTAPAAGNPLGPFLQRYLVRGDAPRAAAFTGDRPGSKTAYSNVGAALAALAVERVAAESFTTFSTKRVFAPLGMSATTWTRPDPARAFATPHAFEGGAFVALSPRSHAVYPAVDLHASARDLARFARAMLRDGELDGARILSAKSTRAMLGGDAGAPIGWQARIIGGRNVVGHEGEDAGVSTGLFLDRAAGTGALVLANGDAFGSGERARAEAIQTMIFELLATTM